VEAHLILLSQGGSANAHLESVLTERFQRAGTKLPKGGLRTLMSEPQLIAPKKQEIRVFAPAMSTGRHLAEDSLDLVPEAITDEDEGAQEETQASVAAAAAAVLGALGGLGAAGCILAAALRKRGRSQQRCGKGEAVALEGVRVTDQ